MPAEKVPIPSEQLEVETSHTTERPPLNRRYEKTRSKLLESLEEEGIVFRDPEEDKIVWDFDKLKQLNPSKDKNTGKYIFGRSRPVMFDELMGDDVVYSKEDFDRKHDPNLTPEERAKIKPKQLFFKPTPENFTVDKIKEADFYLTPMDTTNVKRWGSTTNSTGRHFVEKYGYSPAETLLAIEIFDPRRGAGYRDNDGVLMVKHDDGSFKPISGEWIVRHAVNSQQKKGDVTINVWSSPSHAILSEDYKHLRESGMLTAKDFTVSIKEIKRGGLLRPERVIGKKGNVSLGRFSATLGTEFEGKILIKLDDRLYGIVDTSGPYRKITNYFEVPSDEEIDSKLWSKAIALYDRNGGPFDKRVILSSLTKFRKNEIQVKSYSRRLVADKHSNETAADFADRIPVAIENYELFQQLSYDLAEKARLSLPRLSFREQAWLAEYAYQLKDNYDSVISFAKTYGLSGLKTFLACEFGKKLGDEILKIGRQLSPDKAREVFNAYTQVVNEVDKVSDYLAKNFSTSTEDRDLIIKKIEENLLIRGKDIILNMSRALDRGQMEITDTLESIKELKSEIILFGSTFKVLSKDHGLSLDDVAQVKLDQSDPQNLSLDEKTELIQIFKRNRKDYPPELARWSQADFYEHLERGGSTLYRLYYQNELIAFIRLESVGPGRVYAGSLNVRPEIRGLSIGTAMLKAIIEEQAHDNIIEAVVFAGNPMKDRYLSDFKFKIVGEIPNYHNTGQLFFKLERNNVAAPIQDDLVAA